MPQTVQPKFQRQQQSGDGGKGLIGTMGSIAGAFGAPAPLVAGLNILGGQNPVEAITGMFTGGQPGTPGSVLNNAPNPVQNEENPFAMAPFFMAPDNDLTQAFIPNQVIPGGWSTSPEMSLPTHRRQ